MDTGSGRTASPWMTELGLPGTGPLEDDLHADVCVVGAGIAGVSTAYALAREGRSVVLLDDGAVGSGETSRTTAHLSNAVDDRYYAVERLHGEEGARIVAESHSEAIDEIERIVARERIDCGFERLDGYLFVPPGEPLDELETELEACRRAGLVDVGWAERAPLQGFETGRCLRFPRQGMFHPLRFLAGLVDAFQAQRGRLFTSTHVSAVEGGRDGRMGLVRTGNGRTVRASDIVVATNTPVNDVVTIHTKQLPYRTYVLAARVPAGSVATALFWDTPDPYHYVRLTRDGEHTLLIAGGEDHRTGQEDDPGGRFVRLERWTRERFPMMEQVTHRWSGQVMEPVDHVAFIGRNPGRDENVWVVTGDSGQGMTHGMIASLLLRDLVQGREHPWARLYDPARKSVRAALDFAQENLNVLAQYRQWLTGGTVADEDQIAPGTGAVLREGLRKVAVFREPDGRLVRRSAVCPHLKAIVEWNPTERTWDCPAHGSRFDPHGEVLNGPAISGLPEANGRDSERTAEDARTRRRSG